jgi:hypothetical protein
MSMLIGGNWFGTEMDVGARGDVHDLASVESLSERQRALDPYRGAPFRPVGLQPRDNGSSLQAVIDDG